MKIDIWSDFVCPFCYIGKKVFETAVKKFDYANSIKINYKSFQLDSRSKRDRGFDVVQDLADNYKIGREQAQKMIEQAVTLAEAVGLVYDYKNMIPANTFDAHRLNYYAKEVQKDKEITERLLHAHFAEGLDIDDHSVLSQIAKEAGLDKEKTLLMLQSDQYSAEVEKDQKTAQELKIEVVPTYIFNDKYRISGAQSLDDFLNMLNKAKNP
ncbi:MAG: DsbA family oxidoreductase [Epulopiscium sp.]|nr:DsbA family oxidoreductase [Candidatus Epulonipiscium sp.]